MIKASEQLKDSARAELANARRIVVKVGSNLVATADGKLNTGLLAGVAAEIAALVTDKREVLLVTSGAVRLGLARMGIAGGTRPDLSTRQAAAAVGQVELIACYNELFARHGCVVGQLLLTGDDISARKRYLHIRNTLLPMMHRHNIVPIINENDSTSIEGVQIGENDRLAALIAGKVQCDLLIILSDVDGLYTANPALYPDAKLIAEVPDITAEIEAMAGGSVSGVGRGGMKSKVTAAKIATRMGAHTVVAPGHIPGIIAKILAGEVTGTLFAAKMDEKLAARKQWLGFAAAPKGTLTVDDGAANAILLRGSSLLPVGVKQAAGEFNTGDVVSICRLNGDEIARGLVNYPTGELQKIAGKKTAQIEEILGRHPYDEAVHRDNLILI